MSKDDMNAGTMLHDARMLNSDLGRHVRRCNFSTNLTGRFYENHSMQSHKARAHRIAQMKSKRKGLERSLLMEEKKIKFLEEELRNKVRKRREEENMKALMKVSVTKIQSHVRRILAMDKLEVMKIEDQIVTYVTTFIQAAFRGKRGREYVQNLRRTIALHRKEELASILLQCFYRRFNAKRQLMILKQRMKIRKTNCARRIQARVRGNVGRAKVSNIRQSRAAVSVQCMYRSMTAKRLRDEARIRELKKREKPKRIPLHERRYSIYALDANKNDPKRRFTELSTAVKILQFNDRRRRRSVLTLDPPNSVKNLHVDKSGDQDKSVSSVQSIPSQKVQDAASVSSSKSDEKERLRKARLRASMRVAKMKKQNRVDKEEEAKRIEKAKKELNRLEEKRRSILEQELEVRRQTKLYRKTEKLEDPNILTNNVNSNGVKFNEEPQQESSLNLCYVQVPPHFELNVTVCEDDFEDDAEENEDDLL